MNLTKEELEAIQQMKAEYNRLRMNISDLEKQKHSVLMMLDSLREKFSNHERLLIERYGEDAVINMKTGEITKKEKE
jgi:septal ring factor EnvC (AmiA/AmiB activator)